MTGGAQLRLPLAKIGKSWRLPFLDARQRPGEHPYTSDSNSWVNEADVQISMPPATAALRAILSKLGPTGWKGLGKGR
jgi:hypothetical protein